MSPLLHISVCRLSRVESTVFNRHWNPQGCFPQAARTFIARLLWKLGRLGPLTPARRPWVCANQCTRPENQIWIDNIWLGLTGSSNYLSGWNKTSCSATMWLLAGYLTTHNSHGLASELEVNLIKFFKTSICSYFQACLAQIGCNLAWRGQVARLNRESRIYVGLLVKVRRKLGRDMSLTTGYYRSPWKACRRRACEKCIAKICTQFSWSSIFLWILGDLLL